MIDDREDLYQEIQAAQREVWALLEHSSKKADTAKILADDFELHSKIGADRMRRTPYDDERQVILNQFMETILSNVIETRDYIKANPGEFK